MDFIAARSMVHVGNLFQGRNPLHRRSDIHLCRVDKSGYHAGIISLIIVRPGNFGPGEGVTENELKNTPAEFAVSQK